MRGKQTDVNAHMNYTEDHPRGCGENTVRTANLRHRRGSPPRMRGKRNPTYEDFGEDRITPADAGKTDT